MGYVQRGVAQAHQAVSYTTSATRRVATAAADVHGQLATRIAAPASSQVGSALGQKRRAAQRATRGDKKLMPHRQKGTTRQKSKIIVTCLTILSFI